MSNDLVSRLQPSVPLVLNSKDEVDMFFDGNLPKLVKTATDIAVVGIFLDKNDKGKYLFNMNWKMRKIELKNHRTLFRAFHCHSYSPIAHDSLYLPHSLSIFCINYFCEMLLGICRPPKSISQQ